MRSIVQRDQWADESRQAIPEPQPSGIGAPSEASSIRTESEELKHSRFNGNLLFRSIRVLNYQFSASLPRNNLSRPFDRLCSRRKSGAGSRRPTPLNHPVAIARAHDAPRRTPRLPQGPLRATRDLIERARGHGPRHSLLKPMNGSEVSFDLRSRDRRNSRRP